LRGGDRSALAQAVTLIESRKPEDERSGRELIDAALAFSGASVRIGITGVPGVGKSTFIEAFGSMLTGLGRKVAVLAVDPSSSLSGGSVLGDKSRMGRLAVDPNAFIRPSPAGKSLGGVTRRTRESILLCEAAGFDTVLVETVGVGQSELAVHSMTDCFLLLMLAGAGDELQGIKRGIVEMADVVAITKVDGENVNRAKVARQQVENALWLYPPSPSGWRAKAVLCSALTGMGIEGVWSQVSEFLDHERQSGEFDRRRTSQVNAWFREALEARVLDRFYAEPHVQERLAFLEERIRIGAISPRSAVESLLTG
jgi:LAO/AO transport system kinase